MPSRDILTPNNCDHCGAPVSVRRPSASGLHFCTSRNECQRAKQRAYRDLKRKGDPNVTEMRKRLLDAVANGPRSQCQACGLERGLPGWAHRAKAGEDNPCFGLGNMGGSVGLDWIDIVHPERAPQP